MKTKLVNISMPVEFHDKHKHGNFSEKVRNAIEFHEKFKEIHTLYEPPIVIEILKNLK